MPEPVFGLTAPAAKFLGEMADEHRQRLPAVGRRTRRVSAPGGSSEGDIFFKPKAIAPDFGFSCDAVIADVVRAPCKSSVRVGDEVIVIDSSPNFGINPNGYFRMPEDVLFVSAYGWAGKMQSYDSEQYELGLGSCVYIVKSMICVEPVGYE